LRNKDGRHGIDRGLLDSDLRNLEQRGFEVMVVNARDAKHVPGRKTDVSDARRIQIVAQ
jgi:hypothetical protein